MKELLLKRLKKSKNKKGFTLIEIIVVLVILGILAAIAVPAVMGYIDEAKDSKYIAEARSIYVVVQTEEAETLGNAADYTAIATEAAKKTGINNDTADKKISIELKEEGKYTIKWLSDDDKYVTATVTKNKDITIDEKLISL